MPWAILLHGAARYGRGTVFSGTDAPGAALKGIPVRQVDGPPEPSARAFATVSWPPLAVALLPALKLHPKGKLQRASKVSYLAHTARDLAHGQLLSSHVGNLAVLTGRFAAPLRRAPHSARRRRRCKRVEGLPHRPLALPADSPIGGWRIPRGGADGGGFESPRWRGGGRMETELDFRFQISNFKSPRSGGWPGRIKRNVGILPSADI
jgi:hypothetical protein